jgi:catechol 2,3-dioxygenase-like lactoylglutathione lyase family enzyme
VKPTSEAAVWRLQDVHHLGMTVADIERSIVFYRDVLGMTLLRRRPRVADDYVAQQTGYAGLVLNVASFKVSPESPVSLEVVQYMNCIGAPAETATNQAGNTHLCLTVDDLQACYVQLRASGFAFDPSR